MILAQSLHCRQTSQVKRSRPQKVLFSHQGPLFWSWMPGYPARRVFMPLSFGVARRVNSVSISLFSDLAICDVGGGSFKEYDRGVDKVITHASPQPTE